MALVSTSIPNLLNGVSQQPAPLRQVTQGETQTNALSSVIDGLIKRPPTEHLKEIIGNSLSSAAIHTIDKGNGVLDIVVIVPNGTMSIYRTDGTSLSVSYSGGVSSSYFACTNPAKEIKFLTVNDFTIILNTTKTVGKDTTVAGGGSGTLSATKYNDFSELPDGVGASAVAGVYYEILSAGESSNSFYVKALTTKTYEESFKPGELYKLDRDTLPVQMATTGANQYTVSYIPWAERTVGDLDSVPFPSFTGSTINNLFFYKNRLGFLSSDNVILSAAGDYYRFFPETVRTVLDDGPIDVSVRHTQRSNLTQAVAFNDSLTIFSDSTQFAIENVGGLTPKTISIIPSTEFENDASVTPVGAGNFLFFTSKKGAYSSIREYFIEADTVLSDALDITAHVPKYIPKNITQMATSSNDDILVCISSETPNKMYVYKWFSDGRQKLQSSWSTWELPSNANILDLKIIESELYLVVSYTGSGALSGTSVERIDLQYLDDTNLSYCVRLDRKTPVVGVYDSTANETTWTLPYTPDSNSTVKIIRSGTWGNYGNSGDSVKGTDIPVASVTGNQVKASGQHNFGGTSTDAENTVLIGVSYPMTYEFSHQYIREKDGSQSIQSGRLQMRTMRVNFENTGFFKIDVTPEHRQTYSYEYTGVTLNQAGSVIGSVILNDGTFRFPLQAKNDRLKIEIKTDSFLPCAFQSAEWEAFYNIRSKRI